MAGVQPYAEGRVESVVDGSSHGSGAQDCGCAVQPDAGVVGERLEDAAVWDRLRAQRVVYGGGAAAGCAVVTCAWR